MSVSRALLLVALLPLGACVPTNSPGAAVTYRCTPGDAITVGCDATIGFECTGDPIIDLCESTVAVCDATSRFDGDDDSGSDLCPLATGTCPTSGLVTARARAFGSRLYTCIFEARDSRGVALVSN